MKKSSSRQRAYWFIKLVNAVGENIPMSQVDKVKINPLSGLF